MSTLSLPMIFSMVAAAACTSEDLVLDVAELDLIDVLFSV